MASFPDLRPNRRLAKAESTAAPGNKARLLLAASTALLLTASLAVSELATLRGARAHDASVFLTRELGPPLDRASLVRLPARATPRLVKPALGGKLEIRDGGLKVTSGHASVSLRFGKARGAWRGHQHGVQRKLPFGSEAIVLGLNRVEQSLTVDERQGTRTWRWRLDAVKLAPRLTADGTVRFADGKTDSGLRILPVVVFDKRGTDITPQGLRWSLERAGKTRWLQLRLNDADLPLPYVIDPIALVAACPGGGCANSTATNATSVTVTRPASVATGSLMLAHVTLRNNDTITAPAGWTTTGNLRTSGALLEQRIYYRIATAADTAGTTYQWSWTTSSDGAAAILAYSGTDATNPIDVAATDNAGSGTTATATGLTTTQDNDMIDALYGAQGQSGPSPTLTQNGGQSLTQEYAISSGSSPASKAIATGADGTLATAGATGNKTATISTSTPWVAHLVALMPPLAVDGAGTLTTATTNVSASQTGNTITFTYTAAAGGMNNGSLTLVVPAGWTAPSTVSNNAGYTTASTGTVSVAAQTITVSSLTLSGGGTMTLTYGSKSGGGSGATATASTGAQTWQARQKARSAGTLTNLGSSPSITVNAANGSGTLTTLTSVMSASQTGRTITFTYTAATGGINNGTVTLVVPSGWTAPSITSNNAGYTTASAGTVSVASQTITVSSLTIAGGSTFTITYGDTSGGGTGATATATTGAQTWQAQSKSTAGGSLANLGSSPSITVYAADGTGTLTTPTSVVSASQTGRTIIFTYTAATGGINNGSVTLVVPAGWSAPSTTGANAGYTTASSGTVSLASQTITVSSLTIAGGSTFTITYGSTASGGPGATATSSTGAQTWQAQEKSTSASSLANLGTSPSITVYAADGSGALTTPTTSVPFASSGNTLTFTYTAAMGGISDGSVTLVVPAGWNAPSTTGPSGGYTTASAGTVSVASQTITVSSLTLAGGSTFTITYGNTGSGGAGATAPSSSGAQTWQVQEKSTSASSLANLGASPSVTVVAPDGSGTLTTPTGSVNSVATGRTITFTYTVAAGGISNGSVTTVVPAGWSAPSTTGSNAGYTTSSSGTVSVAGQTITVSSVTLSGGSTFTITYGDTGSGGPGATAPVSAGAQTWQAQGKSSSSGTLTNLAASPSITVNDPTAPSAPGLSFGSFTSASATGTTVYIRQGTAGGFTVTGTSSDAESGIDHLTFATGLGTGWTGGGADSSSPYAGAYTFNSSATAPAGSQDVTATNGWALTSSATPFAVVADTTAPAVTAPTVATGYHTALSVPVTKNGGTDGGSGVDNTTSTVQRDEIGLTNGSCGTFPSSWSSVTLVGGNDTTVVAGNCYRYRELLSDNVGNQGTSAASNNAKVDTTAPSTPSLAFGALSPNAYYDGSGTLYVRPSAGGTFTVTASSTDAQSGIGSYTFGTLNSNGGANFGGSQTGDHFDYTFGASTTAPSTVRTVSSTNGAGTGSANATYSLAADTTAPSVTAPTVPGGYYTSNSVPVTKNGGSDGGSNVDASTSTLERDAATLTNGACGSFPGSWSTVTLSAGNDTTVTNGHCYEYRELLSDHVGNQGTSGASNIAKVDSQGPANSIALSNVSPVGTALKNGSTVYYRGSAVGSFKLTNGVTDGESGPASSASAALGGTTGGWSHTPSTVSTPSGGPYDSNTFSWNAGTTSTPTEVLTAADQAGNTTSSATLTFANDSNAPAGGALTVNGTAATGGGSSSYSATGSFPIDVRTNYTEAQSGSESGLASSTLTRESATLTANSCGSFGSASTITGAPAQSLSTGCYLYTLAATDNVGNSVSITTVVKVDTDNPSVSLTDPGTPVAGTISLSATASDPSTDIQQVVFERAPAGGSTWTAIGTDTTSPYTASWDTTAVSDGQYDVRAVATDETNHTNASLVASRRVDNTAPATTIDATPTDPSNGATPTFSFSSSEAGSTFECRVDGAGWTACSTPETLGALGAGSHTFDVRAADAAGNTDATPASHTWTIDLTAPDTTIDSAPSNPSGNTTPTLAFSSSEPGSTFECRIDSGSWTSCSSPDSLSPALTEGSHTFDVRAIDQAGNADPTPASHTWIIDSGAPSVTITAPLTYLNGSDTNNYVVTATTADADVAQVDFYECSNASANCATGAWLQFGTDSSAPYTATWSTPAFDGLKSIRAVAVDAATNTGEDVRDITIDRTAPTGVTVGYPNGYVTGSYAVTTNNGSDSDVNGSTGSLERRTGDLASNACSSYSGWAAATSPDTLASGKCAEYRYSVADNAGNVALATSVNEVKSDTAAPTTTLADPGANLRQTITLGAGASDTDGSGVNSVAFERRPAGGGSWTTIATDGSAPYSISFDTTTVADGLYDLRSVATDVAGNVETSPSVVANLRIDNTAPSATMLSPGDPVGGTVSLTSNTGDTGGSGIATVSYELAPNGGSFNSQPASWDTTLLSDGLYDLRVIATDVAGNTKASTAVTTRVDNTPPALNFTSPATGSVVTGTVSLVGSATDASPASPPITFAYKLHSDPPSAYAVTGSSWNTALLPSGDDLYDLRARATDDAANTTNVENTSVRVDNAPPTVAITAPAAAINGSLPSPTTFAANASDPAGSGVSQVEFFECTDQSNDCSSGVWSPLGTVPAPGPYSVSWAIPAADGNHALAAVATDNAGHTATAIRNVDVDRTAPNTSIVTKPADPSNGIPSFTFTSTELGSTFECSIDGGGFAPCTSPRTVPGLTDNSHTFQVRATDAAGNTDATPDSWTWHRDTNAPNATLDNPGSNVRQVVTLTSAENDPPANGYQSGIASAAFEYSANGTTWASIGTNTSPPFDNVLWNTALVADGIYQLRIIVSDAAGNSTTDVLGSTIRIDNTPPTTSQNDPGQSLRATKTLTGSASDAGSGIDHVDFERAPTGGGSWTTIATDSTPGDGFQASFDTTSVSDGHYDFRTAAYDVAGNQAAATPVTDRLVDNTPPDATISSPGAYLRGAVNLTSSTSDPGGSNASGVVTVAYEYSTNGGSTWQSTGSNFNSSAVPDGNVDLRVIATDAAGNITASAPVTSFVDNTKPSTTDNAPSGWQSTPVTVTLNPNDGGSGVNVTEYSVDGNPSYTVGTSVIIPAPADGSNDGSHTIAYFSVDNAGNIETIKSTTVLIDATPPTCASCSAADYLRGTVDLSADPDTTGSGIKSVTFEYTDAGDSTWSAIGTDTTGPGPYTASWDTTPVPDGHYDLRILITDNADNVTTTDLPDKVVDNTAPDVALVGAPTEGQLVSGTIGIAASAADATSPVAAVKFYVGGSLLGTDSTAPFSLNWNTTTGADGGATIQVIVEDMAGNTATSAVRNVSVDNVSPTPTLADPGLYLSGTVSLSASSDPDTTQADFERRTAGGGSWVTIASDTTMPWGTSFNTSALADGLYDFRAIATDATGHTGTSPIRANVRIDNTSPAGSLTSPAGGSTVGGPSVTLSGSYSDAGSGIASVHYELRPTGGGSWTTIATSTSAPFSATWDATTVASGSYDLQPVLTDRAGNTFTGATRTITVDVSAPTVVLANPGATISGSVTLNATVTGSGATQVAFAASPAGGASWTSVGTDTTAPWSATFNTSLLPDGVYDIRATVSDSLGNTAFDTVTSIRVDNTAPRVVSSTPPEGSTVTSANAIGLVTSEPATPLNVTLDGGTTVAPVVSGSHIDFGTGTLAPGAHTLSGELQDSSGKRAPFRVHFTIWSPSGSSLAPPVNKNTSAATSTTVESADGFAAATMPAGAWSTSGADWLILRITPVAAPSGLTNGFGSGPEALDVTARWALAGTEVHQFNRPIGILMRTTEMGLVPATFENGQWRVIARVPSAGTLPVGWDDGFWTDGAGFHLLTKHLSVFALLHDLRAPNAPQNVRGYLGPTGLTLRWTPGSDNSGTYDFVTVFSDSTDTGHYGVDYTTANIGSWSVGDPRIFRLKETDLAGNESALTRPLRPVPSLIGKTPDQVAALLAPLGLSVGSISYGGTGPAGTVTGPANLVLAEEGGSIDLIVSEGGPGTRLAFKVVTAPKIKPAKRRAIGARVMVTRASRVTAQLFSPRRVKLYTWRFSVKAGRTIVKLRLPRQVRHTGVYSMRWTARSGRETVVRKLTIRLVRTRARSTQPVQVLLAGGAATSIRGDFKLRKGRVVSSASIEPTFDAAANRRTDVHVIVVDVDQFGVGLISDLHAVFPSAKLVALTSSPKQMVNSLRAGASIAFPRSTPAPTLVRVIRRLLGGPAKPVRSKPAKRHIAGSSSL